MAMSVLQPGVFGNKRNKQSTILFATDFGSGTTLGSYTTAGTSSKAALTGANNGYQWPYSGGSNQRLDALQAYIQLINDYTSVTTANAATYGTAVISPVLDLPGYTGNQLTLTVLDTGAISPPGPGTNMPWDGQNDFIFSRAADGSVVPPDLTDLYLRFYIKYPISLYSALQGGVSNRDRAILTEFKTGAFRKTDGTISYAGDLRINGAIQKDSNNIVYINFHCDQGANGGGGIIPSTYDKKDIWSVTAADYWSVDSYAAPIVFDQWMKVEYYMHRHETAGLFKAAINDRIVCNYTGRTLGQYRCPVGRLMPFMAYSGAGLVTVSGCDLEMRDLPPVGSVLLPI